MSEQPPQPNPDEAIQAPVTDPSVLGGNVTPFDEEAYKQKVGFLEGVLSEQTTANLSAQREVFVRAVGGHREAERVDLWEAVKKQEAGRAYREVGDILISEQASWSKPDEEKDVFDKVVTSVAVDHRGTTDPDRLQAGHDIVDFSAGSELDALVDTDELKDPAKLAKATNTIRLLVAQGQYKLHKWGNAGQLKTALELVETYAEWVPEFNPKEAGFDEAKGSLTMALAALQVDQSSKPNYQYAKPERNYLFGATSDGLKQLRRTEAHMFLRYNDFEVPQQPADQQPEAS